MLTMWVVGIGLSNKSIHRWELLLNSLGNL